MLELYAIRSKDGKWYRTTGYGGGTHWVDDLEKAKIYPRIGPAKKAVSFWASNYPEFGVPDLVKLVVTDSEIVDLTDWLQKIDVEHKRKYERLKRDAEQGKCLSFGERKFLATHARLSKQKGK